MFDAGRERVSALSGVSFSVGAGEITGLLGSNGAGKTTLTRILSTLLLPSSGTALVLGRDVVREARAVRASLSVILGGERGLYGQLSARENLRFFGMLDGLGHRALLARIDGALEEAGLAQAADRRVAGFSRGMKQRLHLAIGLISRPAVLLLDEPTVGLDPVEAARLRQSIAGLRQRGVSVLLTSHYLTDIEQLADQVVMLERGRVTHRLTVAQFAASVGYAAVVVLRGTGPLPGTGSLGPAGLVSCETEQAGERWTVTLRLRAWSAEIFAALGSALSGVQVDDMEISPARLDDAFLRLHAAAPPLTGR
ncbi:MAG TPA: ABC transporter ATP-binding protein [Streptosporangiaceae bacterium]